jgi:uncharacterized protein (TIGR00290 family)
MQQDLYNSKLKTILNWSSGKDAALSYYLLQQSNEYKVSTLLTTINKEQDRVVMHGVREELLDMQAERMGIPLHKVYLPPAPDNENYNRMMADTLDKFKAQGITTSAYGDIHLQDLKEYREQQLTTAGFKGIFPLWGMGSEAVVKSIIDTGIEAVIICINGNFLGKEFLGRKIDAGLLADLPANVDPCGEYGEFHTFVYNAPYFTAPITLQYGDIVHITYDGQHAGKGFYFMDIRAGV